MTMSTHNCGSTLTSIPEEQIPQEKQVTSLQAKVETLQAEMA